MLVKYGASNFFCFNAGIEVSFELNDHCPASISEGKSISNILCVKGANGSGKTNALKILIFLREFCCNSFERKPDDKIPFEPFFWNDKPSEFYIDFIVDQTEYRYELELNNERVISEKIYRKRKRMVPVVERQNDKIVHSIKHFDDLKTMKIRSNASIISTAHQYEMSSIIPLYKFLNSIISNVGMYAGHHFKTDRDTTSIISKIYYESSDYFEFAKEIICKSDVGVSDIDIQIDKDPEGNKEYSPIFKHKNQESTYSLTLYSQSSGTQSLFFELFRYKIALMTGGVLVLDEFDTKFHPHILPTLVNLFTDEKINPYNAQLIFTTHNTGIMEKMGKYRTVLINKEDNESYSYRLDEIPGDILRNDRAITPVYNSGMIGGTPKIGPIEL